MEDFNELDHGERLLGKPVHKFALDDYLPYLQAMAKKTLGYRIAFVQGKDRSIMRRLVTMYGKEGAGLMLKWIFYQYGGQKNGEGFQTAWFCVANKWWTDKIHSEAMIAFSKPSRVSATSSFASFRDFANAFAS
jgi:hypothetical protein